MTVKSCIGALRRFMARRGVPDIIISDNARTFKRADIEFRKLKALLKKPDLQNLAADKGIKWKYIPERAAWWGGFWERLVKSVKLALKAAVGKSLLDYDNLSTLLAEVECIVNSRPLTYISQNFNDLQPLSPSKFLNDCKSILTSAEFDKDDTDIIKSWQLRQHLLKRYMRQWRGEYVTQLRNFHQIKNKSIRSIKVGDVVTVQEDYKPRFMWKLAVVQAVYPGRDGRIRACDVRLGSGTVMRRPVQLLCPLELSIQ
ncbi:PREDICTED: uncharacterized protein LOC108365073 [Rhagoletis zephyria]|uniref:uncharacterized protein LOC108365073 n=1 Tax=Rhagoletis zephyria TaxID=28612 RepID=UPI0008116083|nr:PREDICTED: uncharacterized protein LOC108365073 [Rhagoletis zephyria]